MDLNKRFAELAGIPWHSDIHVDNYTTTCSCGEVIPFGHAKCINPDFSDPREVLKVMNDIDNRNRTRPDERFVNNLGTMEYEVIPVSLILTPGALRDAAIKFMEEKI